MSILVFLEHHGDELQKGSLAVLSKAASARRGDVAGVLVGSGVDGARRAGRRARRRHRLRRRRREARGAAAAAAGRRDRAARRRARDRDRPLRPVDPRRRHRRRPRRAPRGRAQLAAHRPRERRRQPRRQAVGARRLGGRRRRLDVDAAPRPLPRRRLRPVEQPAAGTVEPFEAQLQDHSLAAEMVEQAHAEESGPSIEDADVIVAGGRGLGEPEKFALVEELAKALGGAVAATRAVVDAGWYPYSAQVGQTGKSVSPTLYVALRHLRRDPAQGRDAELEDDRRDQQGSERADLRVRRPRRRRRPAPDRARS